MKGEWTQFMNLRPQELSSGFLVAAGVVMGCAASFITCLGLNLQKLSLCEPANENVAPCQQPKWLAGLACVVVGSVIDFVSFGLAPQSLIAPLAALSLLFNIGMASYLLGEKYSKVDLYATGIIFFGTAVTITNASHEEINYTFQDLRELWLKERMLTYVFLVLLAVGFHYFLIWMVSSQNLIGRKWKFAEMLGYCGFAGITGGQSLLFAKSIMEMIKYTFHGGDAFFHIEAYLAIVVLALCLYSQINFLNGALKGFDSLYVIPCYESYWIIAGEVGGLVYFGEWEHMEKHKKVLFVFGTLTTMFGIYVLTTKEKPDTKGIELAETGQVKDEAAHEFNLDSEDEDDVQANLISRKLSIGA